MKVNSNASDFDNELAAAIQNELRNAHNEIVRQLCVVGETAINYARNTSLKGRDYLDQTGNLRSSVGYIVVADGEIQMIAGFEPVGGAQEGAEVGNQYARELAANHPTGYALIVVAGMNYAEYVSAKGYDVLDTAELKARELLEKLR